MKKKNEQSSHSLESAIEQPLPPLESAFLDDSFTVGAAVEIEPTLTYTVEPTFNNRFGYRLSGDPVKIRAAFEAISNNTLIGCRDLINSIKEARTALFVAKAAGFGRK